MFSSIVEQLPSELHLRIIDEEGCELNYKLRKIHDDMVKNMPVLQKIIALPGDVVKFIRMISWYLLDKNADGE